MLIVEQKSAGRDLSIVPWGKAGEYFDALPERDRPRYILVSDFRPSSFMASTSASRSPS